MIELSMSHLTRRFAVATVMLAAVACGSDGPSAPGFQDPKTILWSLVLDRHAITMASSGDQSTIQLAPKAVNADGDAIGGAQIVYSLSDSESISVSPAGLITARAPAIGVVLIASTQVANVTRKDTAYIDVVDVASAPVLQQFELSLASGATALPASDQFNFFGNDQALVTAADADGNALDGLRAYYTSSDPTTVSVDHATGAVHTIRIGKATITATATAYGVTKTSTLDVTVIPPMFAAVGAVETTPASSPTPVFVFQPADLTVSAGASVFFVNASYTTKIDVVFDDSTDVAESPFFPMGSGNIEPFRTDTIAGSPGYRFRAFPKPGTYTYHSTLFNTNGRIIVQ